MPFVRLAAISGATAVAAAAYGAHGFKPRSKAAATSFDNAQRFHMLGAIMLAVTPRLPRPVLSGTLFLVGTVLFSGSCYAVALIEDRRLGRLAPVGGTTLIVAWLSLLL